MFDSLARDFGISKSCFVYAWPMRRRWAPFEVNSGNKSTNKCNESKAIHSWSRIQLDSKVRLWQNPGRGRTGHGQARAGSRGHSSITSPENIGDCGGPRPLAEPRDVQWRCSRASEQLCVARFQSLA